jgi:hypothetical protein
MRERESSLQPFAEFLLKSGFVRETAAPYCVRHVRRFLSRPATNAALGTRVRESANSSNARARRNGRPARPSRPSASTSSTS